MIESIKQLTFNESTYPDVIDVVTKLADLEQRKPHDSARRLIIEAGNQRIKELSAPSEMNSSSVGEKNTTRSETVCQG